MKNRSALLAFAATVCLGFASTVAHADFTYSEAIQGDLSNDRLNPTQLTAGPGLNFLTGTVVTPAAPGVRDFDYLTVRFPAGIQFHSLVLTNYFGDDLTFLGMQAGTPFTVPPTDPQATIPPRLLGWIHLTPGLVGMDLLPMMAAQTLPAPVIGFSTPLPSDDYSFWIQETSANQATYLLTFNVPEPSSWSLVGLAMLFGLGYAVRRKRAS